MKRNFNLDLLSCFTADDYWKKFFLADDMAMLLTDISRSVGNVEYFVEKQYGGRRISRGSRSTSFVSPPPIAEVGFTSLPSP